MKKKGYTLNLRELLLAFRLDWKQLFRSSGREPPSKTEIKSSTFPLQYFLKPADNHKKS